MIGLDTNVLIRYLAQDDAIQSPKATALIQSLTEENPGFIPSISLIEIVWVMQGCYHAKKSEIIKILEMILRTKEWVVENTEVALKALNLFSESKADFADCLIERAAHHSGCQYTATFDKNAAQYAKMHLIK